MNYKTLLKGGFYLLFSITSLSAQKSSISSLEWHPTEIGNDPVIFNLDTKEVETFSEAWMKQWHSPEKIADLISKDLNSHNKSGAYKAYLDTIIPCMAILSNTFIKDVNIQLKTLQEGYICEVEKNDEYKEDFFEAGYPSLASYIINSTVVALNNNNASVPTVARIINTLNNGERSHKFLIASKITFLTIQQFEQFEALRRTIAEELERKFIEAYSKSPSIQKAHQ